MEPTIIRQADGPDKMPEVWSVDRVLRRWLDRNENSHLTPIDPTKVLIRPHTPEEAEARRQRLRDRARSGEVHEKGFSISLKRRRPSAPVLPPPSGVQPEEPTVPVPDPQPVSPVQPETAMQMEIPDGSPDVPTSPTHEEERVEVPAPASEDGPRVDGVVCEPVRGDADVSHPEPKPARRPRRRRRKPQRQRPGAFDLNTAILRWLGL